MDAGRWRQWRGGSFGAMLAWALRERACCICTCACVRVQFADSVDSMHCCVRSVCCRSQPTSPGTILTSVRARVLSFDRDVERFSSRFWWAASTGCRCVGTANLHVARCAWPLSWVSWRPAAHDALAGLSLWHVADAQPAPMATRSDARAAVLCSSAGPDELANGDGRLRRQPCRDELGRWSPGGRGPSREAAAVSFTKQVGPEAGTAQFCRKDGGGTAAASFSTTRIRNFQMSTNNWASNGTSR